MHEFVTTVNDLGQPGSCRHSGGGGTLVACLLGLCSIETFQVEIDGRAKLVPGTSSSSDALMCM